MRPALRSLWSSCAGLGGWRRRWRGGSRRLPRCLSSKGVRCRQDHRLALWARFLRRLFLLMQTLEVWPNPKQASGGRSQASRKLFTSVYFVTNVTTARACCISFLSIMSCVWRYAFFQQQEKKKPITSTTFMATGRIFSPVLWHRPAWHLISAPKDTSEIQKEPKNNCLKWQRTTSQSRGDLHCLSIKHSGLWRILMRSQSWGNKCEHSAKC